MTLDSSHVLSSYTITSLASPMTNILISTLKHTYFSPIDEGKLIYLDFGIVSYVPPCVRAALICSVIHLMERDFKALAMEFDNLLLLPKADILANERELVQALEEAADKVLVYDDVDVESSSFHGSLGKKAGGGGSDGSRGVPKLDFEEIVLTLAKLSARFRFQTPPYFLNNVRAIATLEGLALSVDPHFNLFRVIYPFVLQRIMFDGGLTEMGPRAFNTNADDRGGDGSDNGNEGDGGEGGEYGGDKSDRGQGQPLSEENVAARKLGRTFRSLVLRSEPRYRYRYRSPSTATTATATTRNPPNALTTSAVTATSTGAMIGDKREILDIGGGIGSTESTKSTEEDSGEAVLVLHISRCKRMLAEAALLGGVSQGRLVRDFLGYRQGWVFLLEMARNYAKLGWWRLWDSLGGLWGVKRRYNYRY